MKKNTTIFDSLIDEFFNVLNEVKEPEQDKTCNDCDKCNCKHFHSHDEDEPEKDNDESYNPNFEVMSYTDEDFTDKEKLEDYVDELENFLIKLDNMDEKEAAIFSYFSKWSDIDIKSFIEERIDHAYQVYNDSIKEHEETKNKQDTSSSQIKELVNRYIDEVVLKTLSIGGITLPKSKRTALEISYTDFANWILKQ